LGVRFSWRKKWWWRRYGGRLKGRRMLIIYIRRLRNIRSAEFIVDGDAFALVTSRAVGDPIGECLLLVTNTPQHVSEAKEDDERG